MSGGSWEYAYVRIDDWAEQLEHEDEPHRRAMAEPVRLLAKAMHDIEWVDSFDNARGTEKEACEAFMSALSEPAGVATLRRLLMDAEAIQGDINDQVGRLGKVVAHADPRS